MYTQRLEAAIQKLGTRWVLHKSNHVQRLKAAAQQDIHKADVAKTFARARKLMEREQTQ